VLTLLGGVGFTPFFPDAGFVYLAHSHADSAVDGSGAAVFTRSGSASVSPISRTRSNTGATLDGLAGALVEIWSTVASESGTPPLDTSDGEAEGRRGEDAETKNGGGRKASEGAASGAEKTEHTLAPDEATVLAPDLACVGLPNGAPEQWTLKLIKLLAFSDLLTPAEHRLTSQREQENILPSPTISDTGGGDGDDGGGTDSDSLSSSSSESSLSDLDDSSSSSSSDDSPSAPTSLSHSTELPCPPAPAQPTTPPPSVQRHRHHRRRRPSSSSPPPPPTPLVSFFSFTRAPEGATLLAPVAALAALFPGHERGALTSSGEIDAFEEHGPCGDDGLTRCLQLDLRRFPLDEHGLVHRFSRVLAAHGIAHMYSATYKTANLIVRPLSLCLTTFPALNVRSICRSAETMPSAQKHSLRATETPRNGYPPKYPGIYITFHLTFGTQLYMSDHICSCISNVAALVVPFYYCCTIKYSRAYTAHPIQRHFSVRIDFQKQARLSRLTKSWDSGLDTSTARYKGIRHDQGAVIHAVRACTNTTSRHPYCEAEQQDRPGESTRAQLIPTPCVCGSPRGTRAARHERACAGGRPRDRVRAGACPGRASPGPSHTRPRPQGRPRGPQR
jgi:hypothetical protein